MNTLIDFVKVTVKAGDGGDGSKSFRRLKFLAKGGPDGGDGGDGGSIFLVGDKDMNTLRNFTGRKEFAAERGGNGGDNKKHGANGADLEIKVPMGTLVQGGRVEVEVLKHGQRVEIARGGRGGRGNDFFKSSTNQAPMFAERGKAGDLFELSLELKLLANIGFVGFPNVGKSTLLSVLTSARPEIGNYPFTTISPNLGVLIDPVNKKSLVIADIPGLIEGASEGKGLGIQFLRHVERCTVLLFVLALDEVDIFNPDLTEKQRAAKLVEEFAILTNELKQYAPALLEKKTLIGVNKSDVYSDEFMKAVKAEFAKKKVKVVFFSAATHVGIPELKKLLFEL